jgi:hypothetical protein
MSLKCDLICSMKAVLLNVNILSLISEKDSSDRKKKSVKSLV